VEKVIGVLLSLTLLGVLLVTGGECGAGIKAENEKLNAESITLKSDNDK
jgi:hypothetical protein